jgi:hypothetical protein
MPTTTVADRDEGFDSETTGDTLPLSSMAVPDRKTSKLSAPESIKKTANSKVTPSISKRNIPTKTGVVKSSSSINIIACHKTKVNQQPPIKSKQPPVPALHHRPLNIDSTTTVKKVPISSNQQKLSTDKSAQQSPVSSRQTKQLLTSASGPKTTGLSATTRIISARCLPIPAPRCCYTSNRSSRSNCIDQSPSVSAHLQRHRTDSVSTASRPALIRTGGAMITVTTKPWRS